MDVHRYTLQMLSGPVREQIERDGARLLPPRGTGLGFNDLLERLPWKSIG